MEIGQLCWGWEHQLWLGPSLALGTCIGVETLLRVGHLQQSWAPLLGLGSSLGLGTAIEVGILIQVGHLYWGQEHQLGWDPH